MTLSPVLTALRRARNLAWETVLLAGVPLIFSRDFAEQFSTPKAFLTKFVIVLGLLICALEWVWGYSAPRNHNPLFLPLGVFSAVALLSCWLSPVPRYSLNELVYGLCGPAWALVVIQWESGNGAARKILTIIALTATLVSVIVLLQRAGWDPMTAGGYQVSFTPMAARMRLYSTFGNPNYASGYLIGAIFAPLTLALTSRILKVRVLWLLCSVVMATAILELGSLGAWFGLAAGAFATVGLLHRHLLHRRLSLRTRNVAVGSTAAAVLLVPLAAFKSDWPSVLIHHLYGRVYLWRFSWPLLLKHPLLGSGWGSYQLRYLDLQAHFLSAHPDFIGLWTNNRLLHNDLMQLLLETGLCGFLVFLWILWTYGKQVLVVSSDSNLSYLSAASVGSTIAILADGIFNFQFAVPPTYLLFFTLLALPFLLDSPDYDRDTTGERLRIPAHQTAWKLTILKFLVCAAVLLLCGAVFRQQASCAISERLYQQGIGEETFNHNQAAYQAFSASASHYDLNGRAHFAMARRLYCESRYAEALTQVHLAERTEPDAHLDLMRGMIAYKLGMNDAALNDFRIATWLDPEMSSARIDNLCR